jgi:hypothetical protein
LQEGRRDGPSTSLPSLVTPFQGNKTGSRKAPHLLSFD